MKQNLKGKIAIVTGASSGIGEATVAELVQKGVKVAAIARRKERLEKLQKKISSSGEIMIVEADISQETQVQKATSKVKDKWGGIDILVANAGVMHLGPVHEANTEEWRRMINTNVLGLMYSIHSVLSSMIEKKRGHIITISSVAGRLSFPQAGVYCASKYAVRAFSESLRQELCKDNIRVTVIEPGPVKTEITEHTSHAGAKTFIDQLFKQIKPLESEDIAAAITYVLEQPSHVDVNEILIRPTQQQL